MSLLCVHPHPDDESIACGGTLARAAEQGHRPVVVTCTGGEEGENLAGIDLDGRSLADHRRQELVEALGLLGVEAHHGLGYRDSGMAGRAANDHPDSFHRADLRLAAIRLAAILRQVRPEVVVSDDADGTYGHPDHVKAHRVTAAAVQLAADPRAPLPAEPWSVPERFVHTLGRGRLLNAHRGLLAAGYASPFGDQHFDDAGQLPFGSPDDHISVRIDVRPWLDRKRAAMAAHRSQIGPDSFFLNVPDELAAEFFGVEEFLLVERDGQPVPAGAITGRDELFGAAGYRGGR